MRSFVALVALCVLAVPSGRGRCSQQESAGKVQVLIEVDAAGHERRDKPVEVAIDFTRLSKEAGGVRSFEPRSLHVVEVSAAGDVLDEGVPFQFDAAEDFGAETNAGGTLIFVMKGVTRPDVARLFRVSWGGRARRRSSPGDRVNVTNGVLYQGQRSFKITTPGATYFYHERGAGFASVIDADGNDWLSYHPGVGPTSNSGSGGKYRGIPNMGHPEGYCHPGNTVSKSELVSRGPVRVSILSESDDGRMRCRWDIFPRYARMTVLRMRVPYWFLYEGTPGGKLDMQTDYCVRPGGEKGLRTSVAVKWNGDLSAPGEPGEWLYFGDGERVIYLTLHTDDDAHDSYWPMNGEMTVFGFGRKGIDKFMRRTPAQFTVGLHDGAEYSSVARAIRAAYLPLRVTVGRPQRRAARPSAR